MRKELWLVREIEINRIAPFHAPTVVLSTESRFQAVIPVNEFVWHDVLRVLGKEKPSPRPMPYEIILTVLKRFHYRIEEVYLFQESHFSYEARILIAGHEQTVELRADPGDALDLALRVRAPIYGERSMFGKLLSDKIHRGTEPNEDVLTKLNVQLQAAILEEDYERAAQLRDQIREREQKKKLHP